jgi:outer membrane protein
MGFMAGAQEGWDLRQCVAYALEHNISVKQADLQRQFSLLNYGQGRASQLPSLNFGSSHGLSLGRRENPTTGVFEDQNFFTTNFNLQSGVSLFNWFSLKNTIEAARISIEADKAQTKKVQDDIALNVAVAYLQVLLAGEQANLSVVQIQQTISQLEATRKKVTAGALPELNAAELESQLARDSTSLITAQTSVQQNLLQLKALLNLDAAQPFSIQTPPIDQIPVESIASLDPALVYNSAIQNLPQQLVAGLRIKSAVKSAEAARGNMYPNISAFANLGTNYIYFRRPNFQPVILGYDTTALKISTGTNTYFVQAPQIGQGAQNGYITPNGFFSQLNGNFGQGIGIGVQVPIFNGRQARTAWERAKLNILQYQYQKELGEQTLKQDIYRAHTDAVAAIQRYNANKKVVETTERAFTYAQKRYTLGLVSTYDLINSQNNLQRARIEMLYAQFDFVFKMKLLEFYKGQGLKL